MAGFEGLHTVSETGGLCWNIAAVCSWHDAGVVGVQFWIQYVGECLTPQASIKIVLITSQILYSTFILIHLLKHVSPALKLQTLSNNATANASQNLRVEK